MNEEETDTSPIPLVGSIETDDSVESHPNGVTYDGDMTVRIVGNENSEYDNAENRPLGWLNSARIVTSPEENSVTCCISVGDPRGAFCFTVRRKPDGTLLIHMPHPGESLPHMDTREDHPGTLVVVNTEPAK